MGVFPFEDNHQIKNEGVFWSVTMSDQAARTLLKTFETAQLVTVDRDSPMGKCRLSSTGLRVLKTYIEETRYDTQPLVEAFLSQPIQYEEILSGEEHATSHVEVIKIFLLFVNQMRFQPSDYSPLSSPDSNSSSTSSVETPAV